MEVVANNKNDPQHNSYYPLDEKTVYWVRVTNHLCPGMFI